MQVLVSIYVSLRRCVCVSVCLSVIISLYGWDCFCVRWYSMWAFMGILFICLVGCIRMIIWTPTVLNVFYACVLYFCICTCSAQLSMFHMERCSRNMFIIIINLLLKPLTVAFTRICVIYDGVWTVFDPPAFAFCARRRQCVHACIVCVCEHARVRRST